MQIYAGVRWTRGVKWEWGHWKWRFSFHSFTDFQTFYIHGHTWCDCQWPCAYYKVIGLFHIKFLKNGVWYGKNYYRLLIGNYTSALDWCHFWWLWSTFEGHFSLGCHFHVHFSNPCHAFASHGLPAIAKFLGTFCMDPTGHLRGSGPVDPPASYAAVHHRKSPIRKGPSIFAVEMASPSQFCNLGNEKCPIFEKPL